MTDPKQATPDDENKPDTVPADESSGGGYGNHGGEPEPAED